MPPMSDNALSQDEVDSLLSSLISEIEPANGGEASDGEKKVRSKGLVEEIHDAILDSGKLTLNEWRALRKKLSEIEELIPHIDFIIGLKAKAG
jgi:hypothetical protein